MNWHSLRFIGWDEDEEEDDAYKLDKYLGKMFEKSRLLELLHDFVLFDGGIKKLQWNDAYFGIKAAQAISNVNDLVIIWHTLATQTRQAIEGAELTKWMLCTASSKAFRVVIITDRSLSLINRLTVALRTLEARISRTTGRDLVLDDTALALWVQPIW